MAALTEEQALIREQASTWAVKEAPVNAFRALRDNACSFDATTWQAMADMGWTGILVPEQYGGSDLGYLTFGLVLEQLGRQLTVSPLLASALVGASAVLLGGSPQQKEALLPSIVDGSAILTLAVDEGAHHHPEQTTLSAVATDDGFSLDGKKVFVEEGMVATHFVVATRTAESPGDVTGISLFLVPAEASGLERAAVRAIDSRDHAQLTFTAVSVGRAALLGELGAGMPLLDQVLDRARAGIAAEMQGTASAAFDMTLDYLKTREQFGKVIGSFQGLSHRAAGLFSAQQLSLSCVEGAVLALVACSVAMSEVASLAKCQSGQFLFDMSY
ncbi:MAG: acyl-CoA/acyl-ACP dehydrogenase, partial [Halioglobus sp.]|nr:acyl-CoA/acyl-ACP dehydrogenase [Halioglobus sp.]